MGPSSALIRVPSVPIEFKNEFFGVYFLWDFFILIVGIDELNGDDGPLDVVLLQSSFEAVE